jgi:SAM-dependent methyltransferase
MAVVCITCGETCSIAFAEVVDPITGSRFAVERCPTCGLGHTSPQPDDIGPFYGPDYHGRRHGITAAYSDARRVRFVESATASRPGLNVLDVGCGDGTFLSAGAKHGWTVTGTELNPSIARSAGITVFEDLRQAEARGPFDVVTFWHTLEHMRNPREMLDAAVGMLAAAGVVLIAVPNAHSLQARVFGAQWFHLDVPRHLFHFTPGAIEALLAKTGLRRTRSWTQEFEIGLFGWTQSILNQLFERPNVLYELLTGRAVSPLGALASTVAGSVVTPAAVPFELAASVTGRGATIILAATRS